MRELSAPRSNSCSGAQPPSSWPTFSSRPSPDKPVPDNPPSQTVSVAYGLCWLVAFMVLLSPIRLLHDMSLKRDANQFGTRGDLELLHHFVFVKGDGSRRDPENAPRLFHRFALGEQLQ